MMYMRLQTIIVAGLLAAVMLLMPSSAEQGPADEWPTFHHDWARSGYTTSEVPDDPRLLWSFDSGESIGSSPAVVDGRVFFVSGSPYMGSGNGVIYAIDAENGSFIWSYETGSILLSLPASPTVVNGVVYVGSWDNNFYALNAENGELLWKFDVRIHPYLTGQGAISGSPAVVSNRVYFGSWNGLFFALNAENGALLWKFDARAHIFVAPSVVDGKVYFATGAGTHEYQGDNVFVDTTGWIYALNAENGSLIWKRHLENFGPGGEIVSSPTIANGKLFVGVGPMREDNHLYALDAETGELIWIFEADRMVIASPAVGYNKVYFGSVGGYVYALDEENGSLVWKSETYGRGGIYSSPAVADGKVFMSAYDLNCFDAETGRLFWSWYILDTESSPAIAYGKIYIGSSDGKLYAFGKPSEPAFPYLALILGMGITFAAILAASLYALRTRHARR